MPSAPQEGFLRGAEVAENAPQARIVRTRVALADAVALWPNRTPDITWALVAVGEVPSAPELAALKKAGKTCDRVAAVVLPAKLQEGARAMPTLAQVLRAAGADIIWVPGAEKPLLTLEAAGNPTPRLMLQALLAVLPSVVVVGRTDAQKVKLWRLLQTEFGDVVDLVFAA